MLKNMGLIHAVALALPWLHWHRGNTRHEGLQPSALVPSWAKCWLCRSIQPITSLCASCREALVPELQQRLFQGPEGLGQEGFEVDGIAVWYTPVRRPMRNVCEGASPRPVTLGP